MIGALKNYEVDADSIERWLRLMREHEGWRSLANASSKPFGSYEEFCCAPQPFGLGYAATDIDTIIEERRTVRGLARKQARSEAKLAGQGRPQKGDDCNVFGGQRGNSPEYLAAKIERDAPDIFARMQAGEYPSARAAAIDAGIIKHRPRLSIPLDDDDAAARLIAHKWGDRLTDLLAALAEYIEVEA